MKKVLMLLVCFFFSANMKADDTFFGGSGNTVFPSNETKVRMVSENVVIRFHDDEYFATCDFDFLNPGEPTEITMGFPAEPSEDRDDEMGEKVLDYSDPLIKDFTVFVDGKEKPSELKKLSKNVEIEDVDIDYAYLWKVRLPQNKIVKLHHTYHYGNSGISGGGAFATYILKTGALWYGVMDKAQVSIDLGAPVDEKYLRIKPADYIYKNGVISWSYTNFKPTDDILVDIEPEGKKLMDAYSAKADEVPANVTLKQN